MIEDNTLSDHQRACKKFKEEMNRRERVRVVEAIPEGTRPTPDYKIEVNDHEMAAEVKTFERTEEDIRFEGKVRDGNPGILRIVRKIKKANTQLREINELPGIVCLFDFSGTALTVPHDIDAAMFGDMAVSFDQTGEGHLKEGGNRTMAEDRITSTSAVMTFHDGEIRVYKNPFAKRPIDDEVGSLISDYQFRSGRRDNPMTRTWILVNQQDANLSRNRAAARPGPPSRLRRLGNDVEPVLILSREWSLREIQSFSFSLLRRRSTPAPPSERHF